MQLLIHCRYESPSCYFTQVRIERFPEQLKRGTGLTSALFTCSYAESKHLAERRWLVKLWYKISITLAMTARPFISVGITVPCYVFAEKLASQNAVFSCAWRPVNCCFTASNSACVSCVVVYRQCSIRCGNEDEHKRNGTSHGNVACNLQLTDHRQHTGTYPIHRCYMLATITRTYHHFQACLSIQEQQTLVKSDIRKLHQQW